MIWPIITFKSYQDCAYPVAMPVNFVLMRVSALSVVIGLTWRTAHVFVTNRYFSWCKMGHVSVIQTWTRLRRMEHVFATRQNILCWRGTHVSVTQRKILFWIMALASVIRITMYFCWMMSVCMLMKYITMKSKPLRTHPQVRTWVIYPTTTQSWLCLLSILV